MPPKKSLPLLVMPAPQVGAKKQEEVVVEEESKLAVRVPPQQKRSLPVLVRDLKSPIVSRTQGLLSPKTVLIHSL